MDAAVAEHVRGADDAPALELAEAGADVGAGDAERFGDGVGADGRGGEMQQRVDLRDGPVDTPAGAHFAPVKDELLLDRRQA